MRSTETKCPCRHTGKKYVESRHEVWLHATHAMVSLMMLLAIGAHLLGWNPPVFLHTHEEVYDRGSK